MSKQKAILLGPNIGEMGWELQRFAPMLPYMKAKQYKGQNIKFIVLTRRDRFDLYGKYADILIPLNIEGDYTKYMPNCFRLNGYPVKEYEKIAKHFRSKYSKKYEVIRHLYPDISNKNFLKKNQFHTNQMIYKFKPRNRNIELVNSYIPENKPIVVLSPRYRKGFSRNWNQWPELYNKIWNSELNNLYNFVICGKPGEYIPDEKNRFYDVNKIELDNESSLIGLVIVVLTRSKLTIGSQSAIPNLSLLMGVKALEWGHQKALHTKTYNVKNTPVKFLEDKKYRISHDIIFSNVIEQLNIKKNKKGKKP